MVSGWRRFAEGDRDLPPKGRESRARTQAAADPLRADVDECQEGERSLLLLYALQGCLDDEALDFEAHLLGCETCFQDLKTLDRARSLVQEALTADPAVLQRLRTALSDYRRSVQPSSSDRLRRRV